MWEYGEEEGRLDNETGQAGEKDQLEEGEEKNEMGGWRAGGGGGEVGGRAEGRMGLWAEAKSVAG